MNIIAVISEDHNIRALVQLFIKKELKVDIRTFNCFKEAAEQIAAIDDLVALVINDCKDITCLTQIEKFSKKSEKIIPVIGIVDRDSKGLSHKFSFTGTIIREEISKSIASAVRPYCQPHLQGEDYLPLDIVTLHDLNTLPVDTFVKLAKDKYVKVIHKGDYFGNEDFEKYLSKNVDSLYIKSSELDIVDSVLLENIRTIEELSDLTTAEGLERLRSKFTEEEDEIVLNAIIDGLKKAEEKHITFQESQRVSKEAVKLIGKTVQKLGNDKAAQHLSKATVMLALSTINKAPGLSEYFQKNGNGGDEYLSDHSMLLVNINCQIAKIMGWTSNLTYYRLALASLLHDVTIKNSSMAPFRSIPELMMKSDDYSEEEIDSFINHPKSAGNLIEGFKSIPPETDIIVRQHHERPDGTGFPDKVTHSGITPLSAIFIVAHDLVSFIHSRERSNIKQEWNLISFLNQHRFLYQTGIFRDIFKTMWDQLIETGR